MNEIPSCTENRDDEFPFTEIPGQVEMRNCQNPFEVEANDQRQCVNRSVHVIKGQLRCFSK
jgi:Zn finger protein HypA/HybF involved in hydrogenase expression